MARFCPSCGKVSANANDTHLADTEIQRGPVLPAMRLAPGTLVSVYRVRDIVGEGGMGVVYRADDEALERTVALKCLHTNLAGDAQIRRRFAREAKVLRSWVHPNVVGVFDFVEHERLLAIVMEYVAGKSLVHHLASWRGKMPFTEIRALFGAVLDTMQDGHSRGIVHRNLKPENILVVHGPDGPRPKIVDFGTSNPRGDELHREWRVPRHVQVHLARAGEGSPHDQRALGRLLAWGHAVPARRGARSVRRRESLRAADGPRRQAPPPPSRFRPDVPPALEALILDALAKDPAARPPSCAVFRERLDAALAEVAPVQATTTERPLAPVLQDTGGSRWSSSPRVRS